MSEDKKKRYVFNPNWLEDAAKRYESDGGIIYKGSDFPYIGVFSDDEERDDRREKESDKKK